ncbi:Zinc-binding alcohol dehydrogenase domain-containing protein 2 [Plakobranchus ocellatus]|uniref:Zinc-binding alcohol dehydrogenase domain-containing protein 2 n=1 Tax=Plakobranchus ocellatus TaxID=259542 RepID=A0AAV4B5W6_9GAST|nr:Zinc-binding alcohol dehydrogenase domain-containing protein 2 [Plakobranchus ocellatus]
MMVKSADLQTLLMANMLADLNVYFEKLRELYQAGKLTVAVDRGEHSDRGPFKGLEQVADAVDVRRNY